MFHRSFCLAGEQRRKIRKLSNTIFSLGVKVWLCNFDYHSWFPWTKVHVSTGNNYLFRCMGFFVTSFQKVSCMWANWKNIFTIKKKWNWFTVTTCSALTWKTFTLLVLQVLKSRNCFSSEQKKSLTSVLKSTFFSKWLHLTNMEKMLFCFLPSLRFVSLTHLMCHVKPP